MVQIHHDPNLATAVEPVLSDARKNRIGALKIASKKTINTGIEIEQCRYLHFTAKRLVWRAKFFQRDSSKVFLPDLELPASVFQRLAAKARS